MYLHKCWTRCQLKVVLVYKINLDIVIVKIIVHAYPFFKMMDTQIKLSYMIYLYVSQLYKIDLRQGKISIELCIQLC